MRFSRFARAGLAVVLLLSGVAAPSLAQSAPAPRPIDYRAYDSWNAIVSPVVSDDGTWLAYVLQPEDGDPTLVVREIDGTREWRASRGTKPEFVAGTRDVVFTIAPPKRLEDAAKREGKTGDALPKGDAGILEVATGKITTIPRVETVVVSRRGGPLVAFRHVALAPAPSASASATASATPSAVPSPPEQPTLRPAPAISPTPSTSPSARPQPDATKARAGELELDDVTTGAVARIPDVTEVVLDDRATRVFYATQTRSGTGDGVHLRDAAGTTRDLLTGKGRYRQLAIARDGSHVAFVSDRATFGTRDQHDALFVLDAGAPAPSPTPVADLGSSAFATAVAPSANGSISFTRDGRLVRFGTALATPVPAAPTPAPMKVDIWSWNDARLQSEQRHNAARDAKATNAATYDVTTGALAQVARTSDESAEFAQSGYGAGSALVLDRHAYEKSASWTGEMLADAYAVRLRDGARTTRGRALRDAQISPGGRYLLNRDRQSRHYVATRLSDGARVVLAPHAGVSFAQEQDDHPAPPPPYGIAGWTVDDAQVLVYDRYDVWLCEPRTGSARNLTAGAGRRTQTVYSPMRTDPEPGPFSLERPLLFSLFDERNDDQGFAQLPAGGGVPKTLMRGPYQLTLVGAQSPYTPLHDRVAAPLRARDADRYVFALSDTRTYRDLRVADATFRSPRKVTDANPQQAQYRWANARQVSFIGPRGEKLRATMFTPDGFDAKRDKRPMLVTFYERWSSLYHSYLTPAPGTSPNILRYVSNGYVVLQPDAVFEVGHPGRSGQLCIDRAVDAALAVGGIDPKRIGLAGHSWSGYEVNYIVAHTNRYRAAEAGAAVDDMISAYGGIRLESGNVRESQYEVGQSRIGAPPWARRDLYLENSGLFDITHVQTPYLTIHNDADGAVPQNQGIEFITALRRLGKLGYLFSFDGEEHNLVGREQQKYWTVHLDEWFDYWLKGAARPAWFDGVPYLERGRRDVRSLFGEEPITS